MKYINIITISALLGGVITMQAQEKSYGSWETPITSSAVCEGKVQFGQLFVDQGQLYWLELRPSEGGKTTLVTYPGFVDKVPSEYNVRSTVHEYGGGSALVQGQTIYFTNYNDQQLYKIEPGFSVQKVTNAPNLRFADYVLHPNGLWLYSIVEDHSNPLSVQNAIAKIDLDTGNIEIIISGHDFFITPRISPDGTKLAYVFWNFPNMPWNETELWITDLNSETGIPEMHRKVAGSAKESAVEPRWNPYTGKLFYVSDKNGFWNLYEEEEGIVLEKNAEFTYPPWFLGTRSYTFIQLDGKQYIAAIATEKAMDSLLLIDLKSRQGSKINLPYTSFSQIHTRLDKLVFKAASPTESEVIIEYDPKTTKMEKIVQKEEDPFDSSFISRPEAIEFPTENEQMAHGFFYPPTNPNFKAPKDEKPPLIVMSHGGPTTHIDTAKSLKVQYWTSRGFAVAYVNYGGSTGYGKSYQNRLLGNWGIVDVDDCCNAAKYLAKKGYVDSKRMAIMGGSAGGYTTCAALTFRNTFQAGASLYGVADIELLVSDTHKYESRYFDLLVGRYPEEKKTYQNRSPIHHTDKLSCPIIFLQGAEDKIVTPNQSELMYNALLKKGLPTAYLLFEGEQHGFRKAENIKKSLDGTYYFFAMIFGIAPTKGIEPIQIDNLGKLDAHK